MEWHLRNISEVLIEPGTDHSSGLSSKEVSSRLLSHGPNELLDRGGKSPWRILWDQFTSIMAHIVLEIEKLRIGHKPAIMVWWAGQPTQMICSRTIS